MPDIFISYSRKDSAFVQTLYDQLVAKGLAVWMDKNDIPPTRDWWESINKGIEESNAFVFVLSPNSLKSPVCHLEINYAISLKKRLIPIVRVDVDPKLIFADLITQQLDVYIQQTLGEDSASVSWRRRSASSSIC